MDAEQIKKTLFHSSMKGDWDDVIAIYEKYPDAHTTTFNRTGETALHVAASDCQEEVVGQLLDLITNYTKQDTDRVKAVLEIKNDQGNTPLHYAASVGSVKMCECIGQVDSSLVLSRNVECETPLFMAALHGHKEVFLMLHYQCGSVEKDYSHWQRKDGQTLLHVAINGNYYDLAFQIIHLYEHLVSRVNHQGQSPLHLLATKASAFRSGTHLGWFQRIIYHCIFVDQLKVESLDYQALSVRSHENEKNARFPENYRTCVDFSKLLNRMFRSATSGRKPLVALRKKDPMENPRNQTDKQHEQYARKAQISELFPSNYSTCFDFIKFLSKVAMVVLGIGSGEINKIRGKKENNIWSVQIMNELIERALIHEYVENGRHLLRDDQIEGNGKGTLPNRVMHSGETSSKANTAEVKQDDMMKGETTILLAAKNGVTEMVEKILDVVPIAVHDMNLEKKNVVLLAVENRQPHVYKLLLKRNILKDNLFRKVDKNGNSALHLAATLGDYKPWLIPGAALQMQWEIKWFEFVKKSMPAHSFVRYNSTGMTAREIFTETHKDLLENGSKWLTSTSESCSVVAALIATVAFATSATVPGGVQEDNGKPTLENKPAFSVFAISSLIALCFSVTAVVLFLSILTSRYQERDFGRDLPRKLLMGLTSLFISIGSMLVSFCAGHFFVLEDKLKYAAFPVYAVTCLPVTLFAMAQFPLYLDLIWATLKKVPQRSYKCGHKLSATDSMQQ